MTVKTTFAAIGLILAVLLLVSCGQKRSEPAEQTSTRTETQTEQSKPDAPPETVNLKLGDTYQSKGPPEAALTLLKTAPVESYQYKDRTTGNMATKTVDEGKVFFIVTVQIEAISAWTQGSQGNRAPPQGQYTVTDSTGKTHNFKPYLGERALAVSPDMAKGDTFVGEILYIIPKDSTDLKVQFRGRKAPRPILAEWVLE